MVRRIICGSIGFLLFVFGISFILSQGIGATAFDLMTYTLSEIAPISLDIASWFLNGLFFIYVITILIKRKQFKWTDLIPSIFVFLLGLLLVQYTMFINHFSHILIGTNLLTKVLWLIVASALMGLGLALFIGAKLVILPYDYFVIIGSNDLKMTYGKYKRIVELIMLVLITVLALVFNLNELLQWEVLIGTLVSVFAVTIFVDIFMRLVNRIIYN